MKTQIISSLIALSAISGLGGCSRDDHKEFPEGGKVEIALTYYLHNKGDGDRLSEEVSRAEFYVFDGEGRFSGRSSARDSVFGDGYRYTMDLPGGDYTILAWCNGGKAWKPSGLVPGVTSLEDARMILEARRVDTAGVYVVDNTCETLFFGRTGEEKIHVGDGEITRDTIDLTKVTNNVRVRVRWKDSDGMYCTYKGHQGTVRPYIEAKDGEDDFYACMPQRERFLAYMPHMLPDEVESPVDYASTRADFRVGRLTAEGSAARVTIAEALPDGGMARRYTRGLVELIRLTGHYDTQEQIDREDTFSVDIDFRCEDPTHTHADTWTVSAIYINGWVVSDIGSAL